MSEKLRVVNWTKFQHYKHRRPPWIKLHTQLLDNYEFSRLQDASKLLLVMLWLLAAQTDNDIPDDPAWIASRLGLKGPVDIKPLIAAGFIERYQDASASLATRVQSADSEAEAEAEAEAEKKDKEANSAADGGSKKSPVPTPIWDMALALQARVPRFKGAFGRELKDTQDAGRREVAAMLAVKDAVERGAVDGPLALFTHLCRKEVPQDCYLEAAKALLAGGAA